MFARDTFASSHSITGDAMNFASPNPVIASPDAIPLWSAKKAMRVFTGVT